ncbi:MAG: sulfatase-like hydrolase/transferase [Rikenellaceae bacterium]
MKNILRGLLLFVLLIQSRAYAQDNVLFILVDDIGYGDISCYNPESPVKTKNIDNLAASGVKMTQAYAYHNSGVSASSFLTGKFAHNIGVYSTADAQNPGMGVHRPSFVPKMQEAGYATAWIGKWNMGWDISNLPINSGFDNSFCFLGSTHSYTDAREGSHRFAGDYSNLGYILDGYTPVTEIKHLTEEFTDRALNFIEECDRDKKPYFLTVAYNAPHTPYQAPEELIEKYISKGITGADAARYALIEHLDIHIGRLLEGVDESTLVIFAGDNGGPHQRYNRGLRGAKNSTWEGGIKIPMIASQRGVIPRRSSVNSLCSIVDVSATCLAKAGLGGLDGVDLMPYFMGDKSGDTHTNLLFVNNISAPPYTTPSAEYASNLAMRQGKWKIMIEGVTKFATLYNIEEDPSESTNVADKNPELLIELTDQMYGMLAESKAATAAIVRIDHRKIGDIFKADSIRRACLELLKRDRDEK